MEPENEKLEVVVPDRAVEVRETHISFRLAPAAADLVRSNRQVVIVAADTEEEARQIAVTHDVFGRNWRDPQYASCEPMETTEAHVFGDVIFRSEPAVSAERKRAARRR
jgi:hypothetical protein